MKIKVKLFALYREAAGGQELTLELGSDTSVDSLLKRVQALFPIMRDYEPMVAVNGAYVEPSHVIREGDEVALLPPFSGGYR